MSVDPEEYRPMVDGWLRTFESFNILVREKDVVIQASNNSLYFVKQEDGTYKYDGWNYHFEEGVPL